MIIVRGLPGSGKSFLVKQIKLQYPQVINISNSHTYPNFIKR